MIRGLDSKRRARNEDLDLETLDELNHSLSVC